MTESYIQTLNDMFMDDDDDDEYDDDNHQHHHQCFPIKIMIIQMQVY